MILAVLTAAFALAVYLHLRGVGAAVAIPVAAILVPEGVLFQAFIYPGDSELRQYWLMAALVGLFFGVLAAAFGYFVAPMLGNRKP